MRYAVTIRNPTDKTITGGSVHVYAPLRESPWHRLLSLTATSPHSVEHEESGDSALQVALPSLAPYATLAVAIEAVIGIDAGSRTPERVDPARYSTAEPLIESTGPAIAGLAQTLRQQLQRDSARAIYEWVANNVRYAGYLPDAKGALRTLTEREATARNTRTLLPPSRGRPEFRRG